MRCYLRIPFYGSTGSIQVEHKGGDLMFVLTDIPLIVLILLCIAIGCCIGVVYEHNRIMNRFADAVNEIAEWREDEDQTGDE